MKTASLGFILQALLAAIFFGKSAYRQIAVG
jgi:hypothetical protein